MVVCFPWLLAGEHGCLYCSCQSVVGTAVGFAAVTGLLAGSSGILPCSQDSIHVFQGQQTYQDSHKEAPSHPQKNKQQIKAPGQ